MRPLSSEQELCLLFRTNGTIGSHPVDLRHSPGAYCEIRECPYEWLAELAVYLQLVRLLKQDAARAELVGFSSEKSPMISRADLPKNWLSGALLTLPEFNFDEE